jgi:hypothetical protein
MIPTAGAVCDRAFFQKEVRSQTVDDAQILLRPDNPQLACPRKRLYNGGRAIRSLANRRIVYE